MSDEATYGGLTAYEIRHEHPFGCAHDRGIAIALLDGIATLTAENAALYAKVERLERSNQWNDSQRCAWLKECLDTSRELDRLKAQLSAAVQAEREACAQEVEHWGKIQKREGGVSVWTDYVAAAIRGRANDPVKAQLAAAEPEVTNEMKARFIGEFSWKEESPYYDENGDYHDHEAERTVPWDLCKRIYKEMAGFARTAPPQHAAEPWRGEAILRRYPEAWAEYCAKGAPEQHAAVRSGWDVFNDPKPSDVLEQRAAKVPEIPDVLFDSFKVYQAMTADARKRTSVENMNDVLSAVVRLLAAPTPPAQENQS